MVLEIIIVYTKINSELPSMGFPTQYFPYAIGVSNITHTEL